MGDNYVADNLHLSDTSGRESLVIQGRKHLIQLRRKLTRHRL